MSSACRASSVARSKSSQSMLGKVGQRTSETGCTRPFDRHHGQVSTGSDAEHRQLVGGDAPVLGHDEIELVGGFQRAHGRRVRRDHLGPPANESGRRLRRSGSGLPLTVEHTGQEVVDRVVGQVLGQVARPDLMLPMALSGAGPFDLVPDSLARSGEFSGLVQVNSATSGSPPGGSNREGPVVPRRRNPWRLD